MLLQISSQTISKSFYKEDHPEAEKSRQPVPGLVRLIDFRSNHLRKAVDIRLIFIIYTITYQQNFGLMRCIRLNFYKLKSLSEKQNQQPYIYM